MACDTPKHGSVCHHGHPQIRDSIPAILSGKKEIAIRPHGRIPPYHARITAKLSQILFGMTVKKLNAILTEAGDPSGPFEPTTQNVGDPQARPRWHRNTTSEDGDMPSTHSQEVPRPRVLVVDDDGLSRAMLREILSALGLEVLTAEHGRAALHLLAEHADIQLMITDLNMPVMGGLELIVKARAVPYRFPIVVLSDNQDIKTAIEAMRKGADDYLLKDEHIEDTLPIAVQRALEKSRLEAENRRMLDQILRANVELESMNAELRKMQRQLVETAHLAGRGETAAEVLHSLGNSLNTLNVAAEAMREKVAQAPLWPFIERIVALIAENQNDLPGFLARDTQGQKVFDALLSMPSHVERLQELMHAELEAFHQQISKIRNVVWSQQAHVSSTRLSEPFSVRELISDALTLCERDVKREAVQVQAQVRQGRWLQGNRPQLLHVFAHLIRNACEAMKPLASHLPRELDIRDHTHGDFLVIHIQDTGIGLNSEQLDAAFRHGFTTKHGHFGFGLHYCANVIHEWGGTLQLESEGEGQGARVILRLPWTPESREDQDKAAGHKPG